MFFFANMKNYMKGEYDFDGNEGVFQAGMRKRKNGNNEVSKKSASRPT